MSLIPPESKGLHVPKSGITRPDAPEGFKWSGGILQPTSVKDASLVAATDLEIQNIDAARAEEERERIARERAKWSDVGFTKSSFLMPDQSAFADLLLDAVARRAGINVPFTVEQLGRAMEYTGKRSDGLNFNVAVDDAAPFLAHFSDLRETFSKEFKAYPMAEDSYFTAAFFVAKIGKTDDRGNIEPLMTAEFLNSIAETLPTLDRNRASYASAKSILKMHRQKLSDTQVRVLQACLAANQDLYSDLGILLGREAPEAFSQTASADSRIWQLPPSTLISDGKYAALAFNEPAVIRERGTSSVGFEIELAGPGTNISNSLKQEGEGLNDFVITAYGQHSRDGNVYELRTRGKGVFFTDEAALHLLELGAYLEKSKDCLAIASVHINIDNFSGRDDRKDHAFVYRKAEGQRLEMQGVGRPTPRQDTPFLAEMSITLDQTNLLLELDNEARADDLKSFFKKKIAGTHLSPLEVLASHQDFTAEFLIETCQKAERADLIPSVLRLFARNALPYTQIFAELVDYVVAKGEQIPYSPELEFYFNNIGSLSPDSSTEYAIEELAGLVKGMTTQEFIEICPRLIDGKIANILASHVPPMPLEEIMPWLTSNPESLVNGTLIGRILPTGFTKDVELLFRNRYSIRILTELAEKITANFEDIEPFLRDITVPSTYRYRVIRMIRKIPAPAVIQSFLNDASVGAELRGTVLSHMEDLEVKEKREEQDRADSETQKAA